MAGSRPTGRRTGAGKVSKFRLVVTDVDGTLTDASRRLDPGVVRWVRRLEDHGVPVVLATGNVLPIALALHRSLGLSGPIVAENGGLVWSRGGSGCDRVERLADQHVALSAYRTLVRSGLPVRRLFTDRWRESEVAIEPTVSVSSVRRALGTRPLTVESTGFAVHLMERGAGKLTALAHVLKPLGRSLSEAVVLGDGDNDVPMLRAAGFGVSFPSASPRARAAADLVTQRPYSGGFVEGLKASGVLS